MWQINKNQVSFRVPSVEEFNELAIQLQEEEQTVFNNGYDLFSAVLRKLKSVQEQLVQEQEKEPTVTNEIPQGLKDKFQEIRATLLDDEPLTELEILETLQEIVSTPTPAVEIEKQVEVIKEVERNLTDSEVLVTMTPHQKDLLKTVSRWRFSQKLDKEQSSEGDVLRRMAFQKSVLIDWNGEFKTGLKSKHVNR